MAILSVHHPEVMVDDGADCLLAPAHLEQRFAQYPTATSGWMVGLTIDVSAKGLMSVLRVARPDGSFSLNRRLDLMRHECASLPEALVLLLDQHWHDFPIAESEPKKEREEDTEDMPIAPKARTLEGPRLTASLWTGLGMRLLPIDAEFSLAGRLTVGGKRHALVTSLHARLSYPKALGTGSFLDGEFLLGVGWNYLKPRFQTWAEVRAGLLWLAGLGFEQNNTGGFFWVEFAGGAALNLGPVSLGLELGLAPLRREIVAPGGLSREGIPIFRSRVLLGIPLFDNLK